MRLYSQGASGPVLVLELGAAGGILPYWGLQNELSQFATTIAYERAGLGRSSPGGVPRSAEDMAIWAREQEWLAETIPDAVHVNIPDADHMSVLDDERLVTEIEILVNRIRQVL